MKENEVPEETEEPPVSAMFTIVADGVVTKAEPAEAEPKENDQ